MNLTAHTGRAPLARRAVATALATLGALPVLACLHHHDASSPSDVSGRYELHYEPVWTLSLQFGAARYVATAGPAGSAEFHTTDRGTLRLDLGSLCARPEVQCPTEVLWQRIGVFHPRIRSHHDNTHVINAVDLSAGADPLGSPPAAVAAGRIDLQNDGFAIVLGGGVAHSTQCALLSSSVAGGRFSHENEAVVSAGDGAAVDGGVRVSQVTFTHGSRVMGIVEGRVATAYLGECVWGSEGTGGVLTLEAGFTATRSGDYAPPAGYEGLDPDSVPPSPAPDGGTADTSEPHDADH